jgi:two-component system, OmpR family, sensor kinase
MKPLGRLFWKFFFAFWLAQGIIFLGVVAMVWVWPGVLIGPDALVPPPGMLEALRAQLPEGSRIVVGLPPPIPLVVGALVGLLFAAGLAGTSRAQFAA